MSKIIEDRRWCLSFLRVVSFYEMAFGTPLQESNVDNLLSEYPANFRFVLESVLSSECCKNSLPTINSLLYHNPHLLFACHSHFASH